MSNTATPLPNYSDGESVFEARMVPHNLSSDLVLFWSSTLDPYELISGCTAFMYAPDLLRRIEIIADDATISFGTNRELREALEGTSLVRFNFSDWSITWLAASAGEPVEIQAILGQQPAAMAAMVRQSIEGYSGEQVDAFFDELTKAT